MTTGDLLTVLAEPNRRRLLALLGAGERSVTELAEEFPVTRSAISQHLGVLVDAGLVAARQAGRFRYYRLVPDGLAALQAEIRQFWTTELDDLARAATSQGPDAMSDLVYDKSVFLPVPPDDAYALVTEPARLRRWLAVAARVELRAGGEYRLTVTPGHVVVGCVEELEPGRRVVYSWGWEDSDDLPAGASTVTISITPGDGGSFVRLVHEGLDAEQLAGHSEGWDHFLGRLEEAAAGDPGPDPWAAAPDPIDPLNAAEASLAICLRALRDLPVAALGAPTPCPDFTVAGLVDHLVWSMEQVGAVAGASAAPVEGDLEERVATAAESAIGAWRARGTEGSVPFGPAEMPADQVASILALELLVHGWDVARAAGRTVEVADPVAAWVLERATGLAAAGREFVGFGPQVAVAGDAPMVHRLVAMTGRTP